MRWCTVWKVEAKGQHNGVWSSCELADGQSNSVSGPSTAAASHSTSRSSWRTLVMSIIGAMSLQSFWTDSIKNTREQRTACRSISRKPGGRRYPKTVPYWHTDARELMAGPCFFSSAQRMESLSDKTAGAHNVRSSPSVELQCISIGLFMASFRHTFSALTVKAKDLIAKDLIAKKPEVELLDAVVAATPKKSVAAGRKRKATDDGEGATQDSYFLLQRAAARRNKFDNESNAVRQEPAPVRGRR